MSRFGLVLLACVLCAAVGPVGVAAAEDTATVRDRDGDGRCWR
ncbi:hypothetical protein [Halogeometricum limi]|uniref:Uncharacterized protein n=1 Tax=Halogeometricum limi TaxID=555875 RepID=A0A1I6HF44_9EURY|nr:hypothetical protein [Halogeometricum limi]SFR53096.1 hypothetical protein SAMN04488124_2168 [Halogeometricum limi]